MWSIHPEIHRFPVLLCFNGTKCSNLCFSSLFFLKETNKMELFRTTEYYIFRQGEHSLWCNRKSGILEPRTGNFSDNIIRLFLRIQKHITFIHLWFSLGPDKS